MKKALFGVSIILICSNLQGQEVIELGKMELKDSLSNININKLYSDSLVTSFLIWVNDKVKMHRHEYHTETLYVLKGNGILTIGDKKKEIKNGDFVTIPKNTPHALTVTSKIPVKVISVQTPIFRGVDRIFEE